jgi:L-iditol 2-dehydrogenase
MKMTPFRPGSVVVVVGDGPMGMLNAAAAHFFGASRVILSGAMPERLKVASEHYADIVVNVNEASLEEVVRDVTDGFGADAVFVAVPLPDLVVQSLQLVRPGGFFSLFAGLPAGSPIEFDFNLVHYREITLTGTFGSTAEDIYDALLFMASDRLDFSPLVTRAFGLDQIMEAMDYSLSMEGLRSVIVPDGSDPFARPSAV